MSIMFSQSFFLRVARESLLYRKGAVILTVLSIAVSVSVLLGVEHFRHEAKNHFSRTVSGVDLVVGARTGGINLLLYSVFHMGAATANISWASYQSVANHRQVAWAIPLALGDSHRGYRVVGTTQQYFSHFKYGNSHALSFMNGVAFDKIFDVVLGAEVARQLGYTVGDRIHLSHGLASTAFNLHKEHPFTVSGVLQSTGTPVDNALYVSLQGIEALHRDPSSIAEFMKDRSDQTVKAGTPLPDSLLQPESITAFMLGLKSKMLTFQIQRWINTQKTEPMSAILPGVALTELWQVMAYMERALLLLSVFIFGAAILGLAAMLMGSMRERKQELIILRTIGASPAFIFMLLVSEVLIMTISGVILALLLLVILLVFFNTFLGSSLGIFLSLNFFHSSTLYILMFIIISSFLVSLLPGIKAYRLSMIKHV